MLFTVTYKKCTWISLGNYVIKNLFLVSQIP